MKKLLILSICLNLFAVGCGPQVSTDKKTTVEKTITPTGESSKTTKTITTITPPTDTKPGITETKTEIKSNIKTETPPKIETPPKTDEK